MGAKLHKYTDLYRFDLSKKQSGDRKSNDTSESKFAMEAKGSGRITSIFHVTDWTI